MIVPVMILAWGAGLGLSKEVKPEYTAFGSYALVYRQSAPVTVDTPNPLNNNPLAVDGGELLGEAVAASLMSAATQSALGGGNRGSAPGQTDTGTTFSVGIPQGAKAYLVQTWGTTPQSVQTTVDAVLAAVPERVRQIQSRAGAPEGSQLTAFVTTPTQVVELPPQSKVKILLSVFGVGLLAGSALSLLVDRLLARRATRPPAQRTSRSDRAQREPASTPGEVEPLGAPDDDPGRDDTPAASGDQHESEHATHAADVGAR